MTERSIKAIERRQAAYIEKIKKIIFKHNVSSTRLCILRRVPNQYLVLCAWNRTGMDSYDGMHEVE